MQEFGLGAEARLGQRIGVRIELGIGPARGQIGGAAIATSCESGRLSGPANGRFGNFTGMGIARRLSGHDPQAEPFTRIVGG